jgi:hypothetical protein
LGFSHPFLFFGIWLPKPPLMLEEIWDLLPHDQKDFLLNDEKQQPHRPEGFTSG